MNSQLSYPRKIWFGPVAQLTLGLILDLSTEMLGVIASRPEYKALPNMGFLILGLFLAKICAFVSIGSALSVYVPLIWQNRMTAPAWRLSRYIFAVFVATFGAFGRELLLDRCSSIFLDKKPSAWDALGILGEVVFTLPITLLVSFFQYRSVKRSLASARKCNS